MFESLIAHKEAQHFAGLFLFLEGFNPPKTPAPIDFQQFMDVAVRSWQFGSQAGGGVCGGRGEPWLLHEGFP